MSLNKKEKKKKKQAKPLQSPYYVHFQKNSFRKGMNPLILPAMG